MWLHLRDDHHHSQIHTMLVNQDVNLLYRQGQCRILKAAASSLWHRPYMPLAKRHVRPMPKTGCCCFQDATLTLPIQQIYVLIYKHCVNLAVVMIITQVQPHYLLLFRAALMLCQAVSQVWAMEQQSKMFWRFMVIRKVIFVRNCLSVIRALTRNHLWKIFTWMNADANCC